MITNNNSDYHILYPSHSVFHRINPNNKDIMPGYFNAYMALPWQADFNECSIHWWPAQRPDVAIPEKRFVKKESRSDNSIHEKDFKDWTRGFRINEDDGPKWGDMDMVRTWDR